MSIEKDKAVVEPTGESPVKAAEALFRLSQLLEQHQPFTETVQIYNEKLIAVGSVGALCAVWVARLLGISFFNRYTTIDHEDPDHPGRYFFGPNDKYLENGWFVLPMVCFQALLFRYVLRPGVSCMSTRGYFGRTLSFESIQEVAAWVFRIAMLSTSVAIALWFANISLLLTGPAGYQNWTAAVWDGYPSSSVSLSTKLVVLCVAAGRWIAFILELFERSTHGWVTRAIQSYLVKVCTMHMPFQGLLPIRMGVLMLACDLPALVEAAARGAIVFGKWEDIRRRLALGIALASHLFSLLVIMPLVVYALTWGSPETAVELTYQPDGTILWTEFIQVTYLIISIGVFLTVMSRTAMLAKYWISLEVRKSEKTV
ncbi:hypothetical protein IWW48_001618 [Coemansia sp. RSA 1200]|nr:hypothetical protein IWW48_001618 [Coemansia sp. RSA 1200]